MQSWQKEEVGAECECKTCVSNSYLQQVLKTMHLLPILNNYDDKETSLNQLCNIALQTDEIIVPILILVSEGCLKQIDDVSF